MTFSEYQAEADKTAIYPDKGNNLYYPALGLGEVGEVQNQVKKIYRDDRGILTEERRKEIKKELGDVIWYVSAMCTEMKVSLEDVAAYNISKLKSRKERGSLQGSGDNR